MHPVQGTDTAPPGFRPPRWPLLALLRPRQWVKNAFVLAPLAFTGEFRQPAAALRALLVLVLFCIASAATYVLNDLLDAPQDRLHPRKRYTRPIAAGLVTAGQARLLLALLYAVLLAGLWLERRAMLAVGGYVVLNLAYSLKLKHVPVVDLFAIAASFVLRVFAGALALGAPVSAWMFVTTLALALYLAAIKRRQELTASGAAARTVLAHYSLKLLDTYSLVAGIGAMVFYSLFATTVRPALIGTVPLVLFGLFRYWYIVEQDGMGESPTDAVWTDWPLALTVLIWTALCLYVVSP